MERIDIEDQGVLSSTKREDPKGPSDPKKLGQTVIRERNKLRKTSTEVGTMKKVKGEEVLSSSLPFVVDRVRFQ